MKFSSSKIILMTIITVFAFFPGATSSAQISEFNLRGHWAGNGLFYAKPNGFSPSKDSIKMHIEQQDDLTFKGHIERSYHGNIIEQDIEGYLDKNMRNICIVDQKNKNMIIGYVVSNAIMKLYCWDGRKSNEIATYVLRKTMTVPN